MHRAAARDVRRLRVAALEPEKPQRCRCRQIGCLRHEGQRLSAVAGLHSQIMVDPQAEQIETANANHYECPPNKGPHQQFVAPATEVLHVSRRSAAQNFNRLTRLPLAAAASIADHQQKVSQKSDAALNPEQEKRPL